VINNSWGCPPFELGCEQPASDVMEDVVAAVRAAGILSVHAAGNEGNRGCGSVLYPATTYDDSFSVGATTSGDGIASFSSRGPSAV
jgi:subtilisin family serine protease